VIRFRELVNGCTPAVDPQIHHRDSIRVRDTGIEAFAVDRPYEGAEERVAPER
jgi:hypothetical protein